MAFTVDPKIQFVELVSGKFLVSWLGSVGWMPLSSGGSDPIIRRVYMVMDKAPSPCHKNGGTGRQKRH